MVTPCDICDGALVVTQPQALRTGSHSMRAQFTHAEPPPCARCLSVPVDDALRVFAREWFGGVSPWECFTGLWPVAWRAQPGVDFLPLYLPAGMDLGVRWLAHRLALDSSPVVPITTPPWLRQDRAVWSIDVQSNTYPDGFWIGPEDTGTPEDPSVDMVVPALATIPADAPPQLRAARALALCLEAR